MQNSNSICVLVFFFFRGLYMGTNPDSAECSAENLRFSTLSPFARAPPPCSPKQNLTIVRKVAPHRTRQLSRGTVRWLMRH